MSHRQLTVMDFNLGFTPPGYLWHGEDMGGIPILSTPEGNIFEPLLRYFAYAWKNRLFRRKSSMNPVKYSIRDFLCYLAKEGIAWTGASDKRLRSYRIVLLAQAAEGQFSKAQVADKLRHVFDFYATIPLAMPFLNRNRKMKQFVGPEKEGTPITAVHVKKRRGSRGKQMTIRWTGADFVERASPKRPTPSYDDIERLLEHLRSKSLRQSDGSWKDELRICEGERNWLIARCKIEAGLRRAEAAGLSLWALAKALDKHRIVSLSLRDGCSPNPLVAAINDEDAQKAIIAKIDSHRHKGYQTFDVIVEKKGGGERSFEMPIDLMIDLLKIAIWKVRKKLASNWSAKGFNLDSDALFYSSKKPGKRLTAGAIGDISKDAFNALDIEGSGHRLRAYYLTRMAWLLWNQYLALNGYRYDVAVENQVLNRLADLAGHKQPGTVERHYLDMAQLLYRSKQNKPKLDAASEALNTLRRASVTLPSKDLRRIESVISALEDRENAMFRAMLDGLVARYPSPKKASDKRSATHLRPVESDNSV